jgi:hypothetical protein
VPYTEGRRFATLTENLPEPPSSDLLETREHERSKRERLAAPSDMFVR